MEPTNYKTQENIMKQIRHHTSTHKTGMFTNDVSVPTEGNVIKKESNVVKKDAKIPTDRNTSHVECEGEGDTNNY
jgi:hypothetical protein